MIKEGGVNWVEVGIVGGGMWNDGLWVGLRGGWILGKKEGVGKGVVILDNELGEGVGMVGVE